MTSLDAKVVPFTENKNSIKSNLVSFFAKVIYCIAIKLGSTFISGNTDL